MRLANLPAVMCGRRHLLGRAAALAALLLGPATAARAAYAPGCTVALDLPGAIHEANAVAIQADGRIVVAGYAKSGTDKDFLVARFHPDLTLDTSFNGTGYRVDNLQGLDDEIYGLAIQFDQKIVVAGYSDKNSSKRFIALARYNRNGSPDTTFAGTGYFIADLYGGSTIEELHDVAIQPDGKIVATGFDTYSNRQLIALRLTKTGGLDTSFNGSGLVEPTISGANMSAGHAVTVDPNGGILIAGEATFATNDFLTLRLRSDGTLDPGFAGSGFTSLDVGGGSVDSASSVARQPNGAIVVAGTSNGNVAAARYATGGGLDASFGGGVVVQNLGGTDAANAVALDGAGKIVVAGESSLPPANFAFARFLPGGGLDLLKMDDVSGLDDRARALAITRLGKLLLAGSGQGANPQLTLSLYNPDGSQDCGNLFLHPTADSVSDFTSVGTCGSHAACVNDQAGDAPTGPPAANDGTTTMVESPAPAARELYQLADGLLPAGKVVTEIEVVSQLAWSGAPTVPTAALLYQRQGFDPTAVASGTIAVSNTSFLGSRSRATNLNWSSAELDALEIGLDHLGGTGLRMTQTYVRVAYGDSLVKPVQTFTASASGDAANGQVFLNWLNPSYGLYDKTVVRRVAACPALPTDGVVVASQAAGIGQPDGFVDAVPLGPTYYYAAFVEDAEGRPSSGVCIEATPFDRTAGKVEWAYDTAISALTTPGLRVDVPGSKSTVYTVDNNGVVHAIVGGPVADGGGRWPAGWKPFRLDDVAQSRPPIVPLPSSQVAVLLGAQDGRAYAIDATTGDVIWKSARLGADVQAAPAAVLSGWGGGKDLVFVGTRNAGQPNRLYAINASDGTVAWYFDNGGVANGIGMIVSGPLVDYGSGRVYFTSAAGASGNDVWCIDYLSSSSPQTCWASFGVSTGGGGDIQASPILFGSSIYVSKASPGGDLRAVSPVDGSDSLVAALGSGGAKGYVFPLYGTNDVFAATSSTVWSIDTSVPTSNWSGTCVTTPSTPTVVPFTDFVFLGSAEGKLFQMSAASGSGCPSPPSACVGDCASTIVGAPAYDIVKAMLYSGTDEGKVYGVRVPFP